MSNYTSTPAFGDQSSYAQQQWPSSNPSPSSSVLPHNFPLPSNFSEPRDGSNNMNGFDANSRLPGLGVGAGGPLPPPPFPFMAPLTPSQFPPPPFGPFQMPLLGYPPMPMPTPPMPIQQNLPPTSENSSHRPVGVSNAMGLQAGHPTHSRTVYDQEEGEVTDADGWRGEKRMGLPPRTGSSHTSPVVNGHKHSAMGTGLPSKNATINGRIKNLQPPEIPSSKNPEKIISDVEEGEASSSASSASSRDSGSPYNPPMSVTAGSPISDRGLPSGINERSNPSGRGFSSQNENQPQAQSASGKSPGQLRVQAQGALLSLAPHNIRYEELVGEGINPVILRQLYEEVGIKVHTPQPDTTRDMPAKPDISTAVVPIVDQIQAITERVGPAQSQGTEAAVPGSVNDNQQPPSPAGRPSPASQPDMTKPLERKEVIARMLAAKAAKSSGTSPSPQANVPKEAPAIPVSKIQDVDTSSSEAPKEVPVREKNKAQTELARKRIEQLKNQGLIRNQQKSSHPDSISQDQPHRSGEIEQVSAPPNVTPAAIQHPLPERPPQPEQSPANLPGLFMTEDPPSEFHVTPVQGLSLDPTPHPRVTQRKRPRASDFDEPSNIQMGGLSQGAKNAAPEDRLVIDISDDEFYEDDENYHMDVETPADQAQLTDSLMASAELSGQTPRGNDQAHIRRKDLEIQAMRQKIAELEQRKKAKLAASRTQSPPTLNFPVSSLGGSPVGAGSESSNLPSAEPAIATGYNSHGMDAALEAVHTGQVASGMDNPTGMLCPRDLSSMNSTELAIMRSKFLRKREIELGLPDLDAEIEHSEAQLSGVKKDEEKLYLSIAKGKQGRQRLVGELERLGLELNGLTLEELEAAQRNLESEKPSSSPDKASTLPPNVSGGDDTPMPDFSLSSEEGQKEAGSFQETGSARQGPQAGIGRDSTPSGVSQDNRNAVDPEREASHTYESDSAGSAMDESSDSSSSSSISDSQDASQRLAAPVPGAILSQDTDKPTVDESAENDIYTGAEYDPLEHAQIPTDSSPEVVSSVSGDQAEDEREASPASSAVSEAYEPPEPEPDPDSDSVDSQYTPPFSPVFPGPEEPDMSPRPLPNQFQADEPLTGKVQETGADSRGHAQNVPETQDTKHKFSPYESPLKYFKAYRYHPNYPDAVSDGYRSLTYSHNFDPMKYLCPFEASGGVCNDRSCESQHFRDITLSDDRILVQMGSLREGKTPEEKDHYIAGLKQIINEMRRDKVKDFNTVATEIAAYRRRFLQDLSRVLPL